MSIHHFHVVENQMNCCGCVPLGMAIHLVAAIDLAITIALCYMAVKFYEASHADPGLAPD